MSKEAMKLALEALIFNLANWQRKDKAVAALKQALEQPEPEPVAWTDEDFTELIVSEDIAKDIGATVPLYISPPETAELMREIAALSANALDDYKMIQSLMAEREPEPVALGHKEKDKYEFVPTAKWFGELPDGVHHLYTSPPKREPEPVAWTLLLVGEHHGIIGKAGETFESHPNYYKRVDVYTSPPKRKPLTDEEIILIVAECASSHQHTDIHFARAIERAHGIKGLV